MVLIVCEGEGKMMRMRVDLRRSKGMWSWVRSLESGIGEGRKGEVSERRRVIVMWEREDLVEEYEN